MDARVTELHCIMPIGNVPSVLEHGILSHARASRLRHHSVAMQPVQDRRDARSVPQGLKLHQYANLYFQARNPMLFKRKDEVSTLCVLRVSTLIFDVPGTVISDCNASSDYARFLAPSQSSLLNFDDIYATDWRHQGNAPRFFQHKSRKCAEVLVPERIDPKFLIGAHVADQDVADVLAGLGFALPITIDPILFSPAIAGE